MVTATDFDAELVAALPTEFGCNAVAELFPAPTTAPSVEIVPSAFKTNTILVPVESGNCRIAVELGDTANEATMPNSDRVAIIKNLFMFIPLLTVVPRPFLAGGHTLFDLASHHAASPHLARGASS